LTASRNPACLGLRILGVQGSLTSRVVLSGRSLAYCVARRPTPAPFLPQRAARSRAALLEIHGSQRLLGVQGSLTSRVVLSGRPLAYCLARCSTHAPSLLQRAARSKVVPLEIHGSRRILGVQGSLTSRVVLSGRSLAYCLACCSTHASFLLQRAVHPKAVLLEIHEA